MITKEYLIAENGVRKKLHLLINNRYGPQHTIDILKECIKILQPYAEKEKEKTHV